MARLNKDLSNASGHVGGGRMPLGWHRAMYRKSEIRTTKSKTGQGLWLEGVFLDSPHKGTAIRHWINVQNANPKAVEIGDQELKQLALACELANPDRVEDSIELHSKPFMVRIDDDGDDPKYGPQTRVGAYMSISAYAEKMSGGSEGSPQAEEDYSQAPSIDTYDSGVPF